MKKIAINGRFLARRQTGQERFATEVVRALEKICEPHQIVLVVPEEVKKDIRLNNIDVVKFGKCKSHFWEQIDFYRYIKKHNMQSLNLCTIQPILSPGLICIHDISYKINPQFFKTMYGRLSAMWHKFNYYIAMKKSPIIFTVTECAKREIVEVYNINPDKVVVVPNGWEHIERLDEDSQILQRIPQIKLDEYYISVGSLAPNKNIKWIFEAAKCNPNKQFVIVGKANAVAYGIEYNNTQNVILTGYVSDCELKFLLDHCKALIFPSTYEGFGIPPLEALALGKQAIVAKASCMPEIFQDYVHYLDPYNPNVSIDELMSTQVESPEKLLKKYSYVNAAKIIYKTLLENEG